MPAFTFNTKLSSPTGSRFGNSVAISGSTLVIGSYDDTASSVAGGAAFVFVLEGNVWVLQATLTAPDFGAGYLFGYQVAISGDTIAVSSPDFPINGASGAVYIYTRSGLIWTLQQEIQDPGHAAQSGNHFGNALALNGDTLFVGSNTDNVALASTWIYLRSAGVWSLSQQILFDEGVGQALPLMGNPFSMTATLAALGYAVILNGNIGEVQMWNLVAGTWDAQQILTPSDGVALDKFGRATSVAGNLLFVGAPGHGTNKGAVYVFTLSGGVWSQTQEIIPPAALQGNFGMSVSSDGANLFVGAPEAGASEQGAVGYYTLVSGVWTLQQIFAPTDLIAFALFGAAVGFNSVNSAIGAIGEAGEAASLGVTYVSDPAFGFVALTFKGQKVYSS